MESLINQEKCSQCKICIEVCPCNVLGFDDQQGVFFISERKSICLECAQCMAVCKTGAIQINGLQYGTDLIEFPDNKVDYKDFNDFIATRRSVRNYKDKPVPDEIIEKIIDSVSFAPFGASPDKMNITVINSRKKIESALPHIENFLNNIVKWINNPIASFMIKINKGAEIFNTIKNHLYPIAKLENYKLKYGDRITRGAPSIIVLHAEKDAEEHTNNAMIYATYLMLSAHSLGLGASMIGIVPAAINKVKEVRDIFKIPENHEAVMSLILGFPKFKYKRTIKRDIRKINWLN